MFSRPTPKNSIDASTKRETVEAALMARIAGGESGALSELHDRLFQPLYSIALLILKDGAEAEDIVQDVFLMLWRKAGQFSAGRGSVFSWAATLTRNHAIDCVRRRNRLTVLIEDNKPAEDSQSGDAQGVRGQAADADDARVIHCALIALPNDEKTVLELAFFGGLSHLEIAQRLELPHGTIKSRVRRGLARLRRLLAQSGFGAEAGADVALPVPVAAVALEPLSAAPAALPSRPKTRPRPCDSPLLRDVALRLNLPLP